MIKCLQQAVNIKNVLTLYYEVDNTYDNVKSDTVTWPCLFQLTTQLAQDANISREVSFVLMRMNC